MITGRSLVGVTARESLERMAEIIDLPVLPQPGRRRRARKAGTWVSAWRRYIEAAPGPREEGGGGGMMGPEQMRMRLEPDGIVSVFTSQMPHGQGHETTFAQIAADEIGVPFEQVRVVAGDSDSAPMGFGTGGSRAATMAGGATLHTARALRERILEVSADLLEASASDLELADGKVAVRGVPVSAITLADVAARVARAARRDACVRRRRRRVVGTARTARSSRSTSRPDRSRVERYIVVEDCGALINPAIVEGQVRGGVAQGIGAVLLERSAYDDQAQFLAGHVHGLPAADRD